MKLESQKINKKSPLFLNLMTVIIEELAATAPSNVSLIHQLQTLIKSQPPSSHSLLANLTEIKKYLEQAFDDVSKVQMIFKATPNTTDIIETVEKFEQSGSSIMVATLGALLGICLILLASLGCRSKCVFTMISMFSLSGMIVSWLMTSLYLVGAVALGDFCVSPDDYFITLLSKDTNSKHIISYYLHCNDTDINPFNQKLSEGQQLISAIGQTLSEWTNLFDDLKIKQSIVTKSIGNIVTSLSNLSSLVDCSHLRTHYVDATTGLCYSGLYGLTLMLLSSLATGLLFAIMLLVYPHTWNKIRKRDGGVGESGEKENYKSLQNSAQSSNGQAGQVSGSGHHSYDYKSSNRNCKKLDSDIENPFPWGSSVYVI